MLSHSLSQLQVQLDPSEPLHIEMPRTCRGAYAGSYAPSSNEGGGAPPSEGGRAAPSENGGLGDTPSVSPLLMSARAIVSPLLSTSNQLSREPSHRSTASSELPTSTGPPRLHSCLRARQQQLMAQSAGSASLESASSSDPVITMARATTNQAPHCSLQPPLQSTRRGRASSFASTWSSTSSAGSEASAEVAAMDQPLQSTRRGRASSFASTWSSSAGSEASAEVAAMDQ